MTELHPMAGTRLHAFMSVHPESPLQTAYPDASGHDPVLEKYVGHAKTYEAGVREGGITMRPEPGHTPEKVGHDEWYGVGGARNPRTDRREPEVVIPLHRGDGKSAQFNTNHALEHILRAEGHNIERAAGRTPNGRVWSPGYAGGWEENGNAVMDYSSVYRNGEDPRGRAMAAGKERGEREIFDAKNIESLPVPKD